ncbi:MAG: hypothetical protein GY942_18235, partial [Aestuariibacter sp.]|nr:hypothetical protein [Aestuariibacter sp.]
MIGSVNGPTALIEGLGIGISTYRWTAVYNGCTKSGEVRITNNQVKVSANVSSSVVCEDRVVLTGSTAQVGESGQWTVGSGTGVFSPVAASESVTVTGMTAGQNTYRWTITNGAGCSGSADANVYYARITTADAGDDDTVCGNSGTLSGNTVLYGTGSWSTEGTASFVNSSEPLTSVGNLSSGTNKFVWTISDNGCESRDEVLISYFQVTADAGADATVCSNSGSLTAGIPTIGTGVWSIESSLSSNLLIDASNSTYTTVSNLGAEENIFKWTVSRGECDAVDYVKLINRDPNVSAGATFTVCSDNTSLTASLPSGASGQWSVTGTGTGVFALPSSNTTDVSGLGHGDNIFRWSIVTKDGCKVSDDVTVVNDRYQAVASSDATSVCVDEVGVSGNSVPMGWTGSWSSNSLTNAVFADATQSVTNVTFVKPSNTLTWTISRDLCVTSSEITVVSNSFAVVSNDVATCSSVASLSASASDITGSNINGSVNWTWSYVSGTGSLIGSVNGPTALIEGLGIGISTYRW